MNQQNQQNQMDVTGTLTEEQQKRAARIVRYYIKMSKYPGYDGSYVEAKVNASKMPDMAQYIMHLYYNA